MDLGWTFLDCGLFEIIAWTAVVMDCGFWKSSATLLECIPNLLWVWNTPNAYTPCMRSAKSLVFPWFCALSIDSLMYKIKESSILAPVFDISRPNFFWHRKNGCTKSATWICCSPAWMCPASPYPLEEPWPGYDNVPPLPSAAAFGSTVHHNSNLRFHL